MKNIMQPGNTGMFEREGRMKMAKLETVIHDESFDGLVNRIEDGIMRGSISASLEDKSDFTYKGANIHFITFLFPILICRF